MNQKITISMFERKYHILLQGSKLLHYLIIYQREADFYSCAGLRPLRVQKKTKISKLNYSVMQGVKFSTFNFWYGCSALRNICHSRKAGAKELVAYQIPDFCAKHLFILEILSFQAVNMTLHLK